MRRLAPVFFAFVSLSANAENSSFDSRFDSGIERVDLIELYTSEGCSSCPPADRWLSSLKSDERLWKDFAPIALHVDYWDYIGWKDRFAKPEYSDRQRRYALEGGSRTVYTPGVFVNGKDWRGWRYGDVDSKERSRPGNLALAVNGEDVAVHFDAEDMHDKPLAVHVALLAMNRETNVKAGENANRILRHDFVVTDIKSARLKANAAGFSSTLRFQSIADDPPGTAIVAWVSTANSQAPLQAVGGYLVPPLR